MPSIYPAAQCRHRPATRARAPLVPLQVADGLYVSGEAVARDRSILAQHNISHVVNCVGALYPEYFKAEGIQYKTLWLQGGYHHWGVSVMMQQSVLVAAANHTGAEIKVACS